jgi:predicted peroxiredoxin
MKLAILVNTDKNVDDAIGLANAAVSKGHEVVLFNMDKGISALENDAYRQLCKTSGVSLAYCDHSSKGEGLNKDGIPEEVVCGSQFDNANMMHDADKVIVL